MRVERTQFGASEDLNHLSLGRNSAGVLEYWSGGVLNIEPMEVFQGKIVITVPHMDDGVLACGGTIAKLPNKEHIHIIYATDGMKSPSPVLPWMDSVSSNLGTVRMGEAQAAMGSLGIPERNIHFLGLPDGSLKKHFTALSDLLAELFEKLKPDHILAPFRYDVHPDHLALNQAVSMARENSHCRATQTEYFVYYRWKLLPKKDVRKYISPQHLIGINIEDVSGRKKAALDCFVTQTTKYFEWQTRPNLTSQLLDESSRTEELFLRCHPTLPDTDLFSSTVTWIRLVHELEPFLKKRKDQAFAVWHRVFHGNNRKAN